MSRQLPSEAELLNDRSEPTPRELQVAWLVSIGKGNKEIADTLKISDKTAEAHRCNLAKKLGIVGTNAALITRYAIEKRLGKTRIRSGAIKPILPS